MPDESRRTAWTEAEVAAVYDRSRPGYPRAAVEFAAEDLPRPVQAVDVGAGTGKLTAALCGAGLDTIAVEPAPGMLKLLKHTVQRARVLSGAAEDLPLPDASADLVTAGQAFHWFDEERALPELARVLRPGGRLALFYNARDDAVPWVRALSDLVGPPEDGDHVSRVKDLEPADLDPFFAFDRLVRVRHEQELDADGLVGLIASRSYVIRRSEAERAELLGRVRELTRTHPALVGRQWFTMPYLATVQRYRLRS
jgi:SAM-dependent methyltransferase